MIHYNFTQENDLLIVETSGYDESLEETLLYGQAVIEECNKRGVTRLFCIETQLEYRLGTFDTFELAKVASEHAKNMGRAAIVCDERNITDAKFWETVAVNRGLTVRVFKDVESARAWLSEV